jgi:peptidoglycan-N-acetylglucosamine deacetylase
VPGPKSPVSGLQRSDSALIRGLRGLATAALALLAVPAVAEDRSPGSVSLSVMAVVAGGAAAWWLSAPTRPPRPLLPVLGAVLVAAAGWLLPQADVSPTTVLLGLGVGAGVGLAGGGLDAVRGREGAIGGGVGLAVLVALVAIDGVHGTVWAGVVFGAAIAAVGVLGRDRGPARTPRVVRLAAIAAVVLTAGAAFWIGANSHTASWFGSQVAHGPRDTRRVAITFDDGPNNPYTLEIARILDDHGAKGTFFMVGKALERRPDIARALREEGHLLGNHSYHHDSWRWLDPRYPELERTQRVFEEDLGVCPTYYRAPHGQHTPFMARVIGHHGMTMVGWDVSAGDWKTGDARLVARRVLDDVQPGSIIVLHDGLDGDVNANRSVLARAMPLILEGIERRGLEPVRLDTLLGERGYGDHC